MYIYGMNCEICGSTVGPFYHTIFLGDRVVACEKCIRKHGLTIIKKTADIVKSRIYSSQNVKRKRRLVRTPSISEYELIDDFGNKIKAAREKMGLTQEDLAKKLKVKLSYIKKIEANKLVPEYDLAVKIEKILNVKIIESSTSSNLEIVSPDNIEENEYTLGDLIGFVSGKLEEGE